MIQPPALKPILALSTAWCSHRHNDGYAMLKEMAGLGFGHVELSHGIRLTLVPGILKAVEEGVVKVSSTHNICPLPAGVLQAAPNYYEPSSMDGREREQWVRHTKRSIDFAAQVGAKAMVCHLGSVVFFWFNPARSIRRYLGDHPGAGLGENKAYAAVRDRALARLRKRMGPYWTNTKDSLSKVFDHALKRGIRLGFENREKFEELPLDADFPEFLSGLPADAPAGYWHDAGHASIKEEMGLLNHRKHLEANASRLVGFHLHDVSTEGDDHQPVGTGRIDFTMVSSFWKPHHLLSLEIGPRAPVEGVVASKARVEALLAG